MLFLNDDYGYFQGITNIGTMSDDEVASDIPPRNLFVSLFDKRDLNGDFTGVEKGEEYQISQMLNETYSPGNDAKTEMLL